MIQSRSTFQGKNVSFLPLSKNILLRRKFIRGLVSTILFCTPGLELFAKAEYPQEEDESARLSKYFAAHTSSEVSAEEDSWQAVFLKLVVALESWFPQMRGEKEDNYLSADDADFRKPYPAENERKSKKSHPYLMGVATMLRSGFPSLLPLLRGTMPFGWANPSVFPFLERQRASEDLQTVAQYWQQDPQEMLVYMMRLPRRPVLHAREEAAALRQAAEAFTARGLHREAAEKHQEAERVYTILNASLEAQSEARSTTQAWQRAAEMCIAQEAHPDAIRAYKRALESCRRERTQESASHFQVLSTALADVYKVYGGKLFATGEYKKAAHAYKKAAKLYAEAGSLLKAPEESEARQAAEVLAGDMWNAEAGKAREAGRAEKSAAAYSKAAAAYARASVAEQAAAARMHAITLYLDIAQTFFADNKIFESLPFYESAVELEKQNREDARAKEHCKHIAQLYITLAQDQERAIPGSAGWFYEAAAKNFEDAEEFLLAGEALMAEAEGYRRQQDHAEAYKSYEKAKTVFARSSDLQAQTASAHAAAGAYCAQAERAREEKSYLAAQTFFEKAAGLYEEIEVFTEAENQRQAAIEVHLVRVKAAKKARDYSAALEAYLALAQAHVQIRGKTQEGRCAAAHTLKEAAKLAEEQGALDVAIEVLKKAAHHLEKANKPKEARTALRKTARLSIVLAQEYEAEHAFQLAAVAYHEAAGMFQQIGHSEEARLGYLAEGEAWERVIDSARRQPFARILLQGGATFEFAAKAYEAAGDRESAQRVRHAGSPLSMPLEETHANPSSSSSEGGRGTSSEQARPETREEAWTVVIRNRKKKGVPRYL